MNTMLHQLLQGLQQLIAWLFRLVETAWGWSLGQIDRLAHFPIANLIGWQKALWYVAMALLVISLIGVVYHFRGALMALWHAIVVLVSALIGAVFYVLGAGILCYVALFILGAK